MQRISSVCVGILLAGSMAFATDPAPWPQWRGPNRDGIAPALGLLSSWKDQAPPLLWSIKGMGRGYASPSILDNVLYTTGEADNEQFVVAVKLSPTSSSTPPKPEWKTVIGEAGDVGYPGSRCTPTIDGSHLYATTTKGVIACLDRETGKLIWSKNMVSEFEGKMMSVWGFSESPLIDDDKVIVTPGSDSAAIVAFNKKTGEVIWKSSIPDSKGAAYSSLVVSQGAGVRQYVTLLGRGLVSVAADDGRLLWTYDKVANKTANIPTPIIRGDYVFASTGYQTGAVLVKLHKDGSGVKADRGLFPRPQATTESSRRHGSYRQLPLWGNRTQRRIPDLRGIRNGKNYFGEKNVVLEKGRLR